ncbi:MAG: glycogen debranching protein GlgX [Cyclobacteriaceae bacterium]|nr:glycogen debranching protein GlgX [Cyclobacteriaceae bacterium SS2]
MVAPGEPNPLGATVLKSGVNFSVYSKDALNIDLYLFDKVDDPEPFQVISLKSSINHSFHYWHVFVKELPVGTIYGYKVHGPFDPENGLRFDYEKLLLDPYSRAVVTPKSYDRNSFCEFGIKELGYEKSMKCVVVDPETYDWNGDQHIHHPYSKSVIYELHLRGFTRNPNSGITKSRLGTYAGIAKKIPYLKKLGITTVELMPVIQFDPGDVANGSMINYWGYSPLAFFAPHNGYCFCDDPHMIADEFRNMVKAFHKANIEVILDVVFNHTTEGNESGPTLSFKGFRNDIYYILAPEGQYYMNYSGCGNTLNTNHSIVRRLIMDALRRWVIEMHIDGFRFDLASIMSRDEHGNPLENPPILWEIESDPVLANTKIIAEAWDAGGLYQVGSFVGDKWAEWNGRFRDDIRRFIRGDNGAVSDFACRIAGSPDLYQRPFRDPNRSINMITCHDGFTLNDLVSYNHKHNEANGENNRDGCNENYSCNYGIEGPTDDTEIETIRLRQIKNFLVLLILSQGTPMLSMGDEVRRTQKGNNNTYCQDNILSWFDWDLVEKNKELFAFVQQLIKFNQSQKIFRMEQFWSEMPERGDRCITWHGIKLLEPDWSYHSHSLAYQLKEPFGDFQYHFMINAWNKSLEFQIPQTDYQWYVIIDTWQRSSFFAFGDQPIDTNRYKVSERSIVVLMSKLY